MSNRPPLLEAVAVGTVGELSDLLASFPRGTRIILSADSEGNSYSPLASAGEGMYRAESTWSGDVSRTPEQREAAGCHACQTEGGCTCCDCTCGEDDSDEDRDHVIVLAPVN